MLATREDRFGSAALVDELTAQPVSGRPALADTTLDQAALTREHLDRQFTAVFTGHRALDAFEDSRADAAVILELFRAVLDGDARALADIFVVGALVGILEPAPAADIVDKDGRKICPAGLNIADQALELIPAADIKPALARIFVGADDLDAAPRRILADYFGLVLGRVFLPVGRHPDVFGRANERGGLCAFSDASFFTVGQPPSPRR